MMAGERVTQPNRAASDDASRPDLPSAEEGMPDPGLAEAAANGFEGEPSVENKLAEEAGAAHQDNDNPSSQASEDHPPAISRERAIAIVEAVVFAANDAVDEKKIQEHVGSAFAVGDLLEELQAHYKSRGIRLERHGSGWAFRTNPEVAEHLTRYEVRTRAPSRAAMETLAIIAYRQPVTRAEIEEIRGVAVSTGTIDVLLDAGWIKPGGRRDTPGKPVQWLTTTGFLDHFDLTSLDDLPRLDELDGAGLLTHVSNAPE